MNAAAIDARHMAQALILARRGLFTTHPNPRVGCVIARNDEVVGEGWHEAAGGPHAEVVALRAAGERARGATAYVTLEPCCHHGRTSPCSDALIAAGIARVVAATRDPNPRVAGGGLMQLEKAGIVVDVGLMEAAARELNRGFFARMQRGRPWVRIKLAASLDGRTALANGASQWITSEDARRDVQQWRAQSDAILTGSGTVLADNPRLTVREIPLRRQPLRAVIDSALRIDPNARVLREPGKTLVFTRATRALDAGDAVEVIRQPGSGRVDLSQAMKVIAEREINEIWVEAGPGLSGALLKEGLVDEIIVYLAPRLFGDRAQGMFGLGVIEDIEVAPKLKIVDARAVGQDWRVRAEVIA